MFRIMSDLHCDSKIYEFLNIADSENQILLIAGDIGDAKTTISFLNRIADQINFKKIIWVAGNHDFYKGDYEETLNKYRYIFKKEDKITFLENDVITIDDINILGCTLWTDFNKNNPIDKFNAKLHLNDYNYIKFKKRKLIPEDTFDLHQQSIEFLTSNLIKLKGKKNIVLTHTAPTYLSISDQYRGDVSNSSYFSDLSNLIFDNDIKYWIHGHVHSSVNYNIGNTTVISNPRGYDPDALNLDFNHNMIIN